MRKCSCVQIWYFVHVVVNVVSVVVAAAAVAHGVGIRGKA
jgi:hypothetical protein